MRTKKKPREAETAGKRSHRETVPDEAKQPEHDMAKRFGVNITRTITVEQTVYVTARDEDAACQKVQDHYDAGKGGDPYVEFKGAKGLAKDAEGEDINEEVEVNDAFQEDE